MGKKLFVGNLSFDTTSADLEALFSQAGTCESAAVITEAVGADSQNIGIALSERGRSGALEVPAVLLLRADAEADAREALRQRIKATRDRMLFRAPPPPLPKNIAAAGDPAFFRSRGPGPGRGRR